MIRKTTVRPVPLQSILFACVYLAGSMALSMEFACLGSDRMVPGPVPPGRVQTIAGVELGNSADSRSEWVFRSLHKGVGVTVDDKNGSREFLLNCDGELKSVLGIAAASVRLRGDADRIGLLVETSEKSGWVGYRVLYATSTGDLLDPGRWFCSDRIAHRRIEERFMGFSIAFVGGDNLLVQLTDVRPQGGATEFETLYFFNRCPSSRRDIFRDTTKVYRVRTHEEDLVENFIVDNEAGKEQVPRRDKMNK